MNATRGTVLGESIRVADTGLSRIVGLLGERALLPDEGLLIVPSQGVHTLGMLFPIDVVVLDDDWHVLAMRHRMRQFSIDADFLESGGGARASGGGSTPPQLQLAIASPLIAFKRRPRTKDLHYVQATSSFRRQDQQEGQSLLKRQLHCRFCLGLHST